MHPDDEIEVLSPIGDVEIIAVNLSIRDLESLRELYGGERWRKLKGIAFVRNRAGIEFWAEVHWYECHGIGRRRVKAKRRINL